MVSKGKLVEGKLADGGVKEGRLIEPGLIDGRLGDGIVNEGTPTVDNPADDRPIEPGLIDGRLGDGIANEGTPRVDVPAGGRPTELELVEAALPPDEKVPSTGTPVAIVAEGATATRVTNVLGGSWTEGILPDNDEKLMAGKVADGNTSTDDKLPPVESESDRPAVLTPTLTTGTLTAGAVTTTYSTLAETSCCDSPVFVVVGPASALLVLLDKACNSDKIELVREDG